MGFFDSLLGKTQLPLAKTDRLFAISTAAITLEAKLGLKPDGEAAICFKPMESSFYDSAYGEIEALLKISTKETGTEYVMKKDEYGYLWVVLKDPEFDDLVTTIQMIAQTLIEQGFGTQLLCAVYRFTGESSVYWIYSFKQGSYYPFVPLKDKQRDNAREFRIKAIMEREMPVEKDMERWYPLWGMPI
jgi:PspA associated protein B